jgi:hypothetical protein
MVHESRTISSGKAATPERWQAAAQRALKKGIEVRQINETGQWVANSGSDPAVAYVLQINQGIVQSCSCPAQAEWRDPVCCHAARYYLDTGRIVLPVLEELANVG